MQLSCAHWMQKYKRMILYWKKEIKYDIMIASTQLFTEVVLQIGFSYKT